MRPLFASLCLIMLCTPLSGQYCTDDNRFSEQPVFSVDQLDSLFDVSYGTALNRFGEEETLLYDVYYPKQDVDPLSKKPVILTIHGGGFSGGNKRGWRTDCREFAKRGFVAITLGYRLGWQTPVEQVEAIYRANQDVRAALRHLVANADTYGIDSNFVFIGGSSAGAITALNATYATQEDWDAVDPTFSTRLGSLDGSGNDLGNGFTIWGVYNNWGAYLPGFAQSEEMVPTISFHGDMDNTVPIDSSERGGLVGSRVLHDRLVENNVCAEINVVPGAGHGVYRDFSGIVFRTSRAACFFKGLMCEECETLYTTERVEPNCSATTSLGSLDTERPLSVFPNPFWNGLTLEGVTPAVEITIVNMLGQEVYRGKGLQPLSLTNLQRGGYVLLATDQHGTRSVKIYKQ